jgi:hypothetical protein
MEGQVYTCQWKKDVNGFKLWLKGRPAISATDETFQGAEEKMWEMICLDSGDGEAVLSYTQPPPVDDFLRPYESPHIVSISGNDTVYTPRDVLGLFEHDYCPLCTRAWGARTSAELEVESLPSKSDGAVCISIPYMGKMFSEVFLSLLTDDERKPFRMIRVMSKQPSRRVFFELIGTPITQFVGLSGLPGMSKYSCDSCGYVPQCHIFKNKVYSFVVGEDLPNPIPTIFSVGRGGRNLCMTGERWQEIRGKPGTRNLVAERIYVIPKRKALLPQGVESI